MEESEETGHGWIRKLPLGSVLRNIKLGREERHAENWLSRTMQKGGHVGAALACNELKEHLKLVAVAKQLTATNIPTLTDAELSTYLTIMVAARVSFPWEVQKALFLRRISILLNGCGKSGTDSMFNDLAQCLRPPTTDRPINFDVMKPTLADLPAIDLAELPKLLNKLCFQQTLLPKIGNGAADSTFVKKFCDALGAMFVDVAADVDGLWNHIVSDALLVTTSAAGGTFRWETAGGVWIGFI